MPRKAAVIGLGLLIGIVVAMVASATFTAVMRANDPAYQCATNFLATKQFRIGDKPMPEGLAMVIARQCRELIDAKATVNRYEQAYPVASLFVRFIVFFIDPINLALAAILSVAASLALLRVFRPAMPR